MASPHETVINNYNISYISDYELTATAILPQPAATSQSLNNNTGTAYEVNGNWFPHFVRHANNRMQVSIDYDALPSPQSCGDGGGMPPAGLRNRDYIIMRRL